MSEILDTKLFHIRLDVKDRDELFETMASGLVDSGRVKPSFLRGLMDREEIFPTGLPISGGVAIPHTDAEHVLLDSISVATLIHPVGFREMAGTDDTELPVDVVVMLALADSESHLDVLQQVLSWVRDGEFINRLRGCRDEEEAFTLLAGRVR